MTKDKLNLRGTPGGEQPCLPPQPAGRSHQTRFAELSLALRLLGQQEKRAPPHQPHLTSKQRSNRREGARSTIKSTVKSGSRSWGGWGGGERFRQEGCLRSDAEKNRAGATLVLGEDSPGLEMQLTLRPLQGPGRGLCGWAHVGIAGGDGGSRGGARAGASVVGPERRAGVQ